MISVPNLRRPSNGSSLLFSGPLFLLLLCCCGCAYFSKMRTVTPDEREDLDPLQVTRMLDPTTGKMQEITSLVLEKLDTVVWRDLPENLYPPITVSAIDLQAARRAQSGQTSPAADFLPSYNVALLLPFLSNRFDQSAGLIDSNSLWAIHFYAGAKLASEDLSDEGVNLQVKVMDTNADPSAVGQLLASSQELRAAHLIIGPYQRDNVVRLAEYAQLNNKVLVSPYAADAWPRGANPNFIQMSPSLRTHCEAILEHALSHFEPSRILLAVRHDERERERLGYFQQAFARRAAAGAAAAPKLDEFVVGPEGLDGLADTDWRRLFEGRDTLLLIVPSWDEAFVAGLLEKVEFFAYPDHEVVVYGMPQWMHFENIDLDYFERLSVHLSSNYFIDELAPRIQFFRRLYYSRYAVPPPLEAYLGYDTMLYFGRMLKKHGVRFQHQLRREPAQYLHTRFQFEPVIDPAAAAATPPIQRFENKHVNILKFQDARFILAN
jgi:hypothetical protein